MPLPNLLPAGAKPRGSDFNALRAQLEAQRITGVAGLIGGSFSGGSALAALGLPPVVRRVQTVPFKLSSVASGSNLIVSIAPGTVNEVVPTLGGVALDNATPPTATISATTWFWLKCVGTFGSTDTYVVTVEQTSTSTMPAGTTITSSGFTSYRIIGVVYTTATPISQNISANQGCDSIGTANYWWDAD